MNVISSCAVIWIFLLTAGDPLSQDEIDAQNVIHGEDEAGSDIHLVSRQNTLAAAGRSKRNMLIRSYFQSFIDEH